MAEGRKFFISREGKKQQSNAAIERMNPTMANQRGLMRTTTLQ